MAIIIHVTRRDVWEKAMSTSSFGGEAVRKEGYIRCFTAKQVAIAVNSLYRGQKGLVLLCIDSDRVKAELRYEGPEGGESYPHIYGPLNVDAVVEVLDIKPGKGDMFELPEKLVNIAQAPSTASKQQEPIGESI